MAYTPPTGSTVDLALGGAYTPAPGAAVQLALGAEGGARSVRVGWRVLAGGAMATAWRILRQENRAVGWSIQWLPPIVPGLSALVGAPYAAPGQRRAEPAAVFADPPRRAAERRAGWAATAPRRAEPAGGWRVPTRVRVERLAPWELPGEVVRGAVRVPWRDPPRARAEAVPAWDGGRAIRDERHGGYCAPPGRRDVRAVGWDAFARLAVAVADGYADAARRRPVWRIPWDQTRRIRWQERWGKRLEVWFQWQRQGLRPEEYYQPSPHLDLRCPLLDWPGYAVWLFLRRQPCPPGAPRRRAWFVMNSVAVVRLPDRTPVPVLNLGLTTDFDSWAWGLTMTLPDRQTLALVSPVAGAPVEVEVEVTVNGYVWTALIEGFEERRAFAGSGYTVTGRSRSAYLTAPYAAPRSFVLPAPATAAQLAAAEVAADGWDVEWEAPDWLVPAGAWSYQDRTPMDALSLVAGSVGARVLPHRVDDVLRVVPRYPVSPWAWGEVDPAVILSANLVETMALRWAAKPAFNGVYVSGQGQGVLVRVARTGTDGTPAAPLLVDPLITHVDAGRERGRVLLAGAGKGALVTLGLPLLPAPAAPGLLTPGQLVEVADGVETWRGLVIGTRIDCGRPTVRQVVELERRYL